MVKWKKSLWIIVGLGSRIVNYLQARKKCVLIQLSFFVAISLLLLILKV